MLINQCAQEEINTSFNIYIIFLHVILIFFKYFVIMGNIVSLK